MMAPDSIHRIIFFDTAMALSAMAAGAAAYAPDFTPIESALAFLLAAAWWFAFRFRRDQPHTRARETLLKAMQQAREGIHEDGGAP